MVTTQAVLFDLDGVLVETADLHYQSWKRLADELGLPFNREMNEGFRGVGRMECMDKLLGPHRFHLRCRKSKSSPRRKNGHYLQLIATLGPSDVAPGVSHYSPNCARPAYGWPWFPPAKLPAA